MYSVQTRLPSPLNYSMSLFSSAICNPNALCSETRRACCIIFVLHSYINPLNSICYSESTKSNAICWAVKHQLLKIEGFIIATIQAVWVGWRSKHMLRKELDNPCCTTRCVFAIHSMALNPFVYFISNKNLNSWSDWILSDANLEIK